MSSLSFRHLLGSLALTVATATSQVNATFATYGSGCPGTGTGLGGDHLLPAAATNSWGSANAIPFGWTPNRFQQIFDGSELPTAFEMGALSLRQPHTGPQAQRFALDMEIRVGYTTRGWSTMDATFAANWDAGAPVLVLPRSVVNFPDQPASVPQAYTAMLLTIPWTTPFAWAPQPGRNLLVEITIYGNSVGGTTYGYSVDNMSGVASQWGAVTSATASNQRTFGPVMAFAERIHTAAPTLYSTNTPQINDQFRVRIGQAAPSSVAFLLLGFSASSWNGMPLPHDLVGHGAPGCGLLLDPSDTRWLTTSTSGAANLQYDIPNNIYLLGTAIYNQAFVFDPAANAMGFAVTNGGHGVIGNQ